MPGSASTMPPTRYQQGRDAEYRAIRELEAEGYQTSRFAGSHGTADVLAWDETVLRFIQLKTFQKRAGSYAEDIAKLAALPLPPDATAELWVRQVGQRGWTDQLVIKHTLKE